MGLRKYQQSLLDRTRASMMAGNRRVLAQLPTGGGKTHIAKELALLAHAKGSTVLVMAHRIEIVNQISSLFRTSGLSPRNIVANTPYSESPTGTLCAMQQTLVRRLRSVPQPDLMIVDEAHHQAA